MPERVRRSPMPTTRVPGRAAHDAVERVVVPLDGTERSDRALRPAFAAARRAGVGVHLLGVGHDEPGRDVQAHLEHRVALADGPVTTEVASGDPVGAICAAGQAPGTLVFLGCRGRSGLSALRRGLTDRVLADVRCPVVLVGPNSHATLIEGERGQVVAAIDDQADSEAVVGPAVDLARALDLSLGFVEVVPPEETVELDDVPSCDTPTDHGLHRLQEVAAMAADLGQPATVEVLYGAEVAGSLVHHANRVMASFLAMAVHVRTGVERVVHESITMEAVTRAPCPVLIVRAEEAAPD